MAYNFTVLNLEGSASLNTNQKYIIVVGILYLFLTLFPSVSFAHAYIVKSSPAENEVLTNAQDEVTIQFDESIQPNFNSIKVTDSSGNRVDLKNGAVDPDQSSILKAGIKKNLPNGIYRIQWKVISDDGHPVEGVIPFQIGNEKGQAAQAVKSETKNYMPGTDLVMIRWLQYISNACFVGLFFFYLMVIPKDLLQIKSVEKSLIKLIWSGFLLLCFSIILSLPLQATIILGIKWSEAFSFDALEQVLAYTELGKLWLIQVAFLFTLALVTHLWRMADSTKRVLTWGCFILGIGLLLTKSFSSHAASLENNALTITFDFLHLLAASVWIGSLIGLAVLTPLSRSDETRAQYFKMVRNFSRWGIFLVLLLASTGIFNSFQYVPTIDSLLHTNYGKALIYKVILFFIMLIFAAMNFRKGKVSKENGMFSSIGGELFIGLIIILCTVFLTNFPTAMTSPGPFNKTNSLENNVNVTLEVTPNVIGENEFKVSLKNDKNQPIKNIEQITLTFTHKEMDMAKESIILSKKGEGKYLAKGMSFNMSGKWNVHVHILTKTLESYDTDFSCIVGSQK